MIFRQCHEAGSQWAIWKIEETKEELVSMFGNICCKLDDILSLKSESKILERLAVRLLLKQMAGEQPAICYHPTGKPFLRSSDKNISISHTRGYVAVALSPLQYVGIDIQSITDKVKNVRRRFVSATEYIDPCNETEHLLLHWSAKESVYKALGIPAVNFSDQLLVSPFKPEEKGVFTVSETVTGKRISFSVNYFFYKEFIFTYLFQ